MESIIFENYVTENKVDFLQKVKNISFSLGINPNWLMAVMYKESKLNHRAVNKINGASGLIQFVRTTALSLGTSVEALRIMSNVRQLDYVKKYYMPYAHRLHSFVDLYLVTFFPVALGKPANYVMQTKMNSAEKIANMNRIVDLNRDGKITVEEFAKYCYVGFSAKIIAQLKKKQE